MTEEIKKEKTRNYTEEEHKKALTEHITKLRNQNLTYSIRNGWDQIGLCPIVDISLRGGDPTKLHHLSCAIERLVIDFATENPPKTEQLS